MVVRLPRPATLPVTVPVPSVKSSPTATRLMLPSRSTPFELLPVIWKVPPSTLTSPAPVTEPTTVLPVTLPSPRATA